MAAVVTFWQLPREDEDFLRYLSRDDVVAIRHREAVADPTAITAHPIGELIGRQDASRLYLASRSVAASLPLQTWEPASAGGPILFSLAQDFPSIIYDVGTMAEGRLSQSNAAAYPSQAPPGSAAWMRRVIGWLRRRTPHWHEYPGYRVTEPAAEAALGGLSLVPYHGWRDATTGQSSFAPKRGANRA